MSHGPNFYAMMTVISGYVFVVAASCVPSFFAMMEYELGLADTSGFIGRVAGVVLFWMGFWASLIIAMTSTLS